MKTLRITIVFVLLIFSSFCLIAQTENIGKIDSLIRISMDNYKIPGAAIAIVQNDSVIFSNGYGTRVFGKNEPVDQNTIFVIASCSKAFTTSALSILVDHGKLKWDDPVIKYIPYFEMYDPWVTKEITIRDLVTHRSGLATFSGDFLWLGSNYDIEDIINRAKFLKPVSSFRTKYGYQNIMYITAAQIIKEITDTSWSDFIQAHILEKLGMINSKTSYKGMLDSPNFSKSHYDKKGETYIYSDLQKDNATGAIGINSSVNDLSKWIRLQLGKGKFNDQQIFTERQSNEMFANHMFVGNMNYGLGWFIRYVNGKKVINHGGGMPGMISDVTLVPEDNFGFVILSNHDSGSGFVSTIRNYILDFFAGVEPKDYNKTILDNWNKRLERYENEDKRREEIRVKNTKPSMPLEKYCGTYEDKMYGTLEIKIKDQNLYIQFIPTETFKGELKHYHYDTFYIDWEDQFLTRGWVKFDMDFRGNPNKILIEVPNSPDFIFTELQFDRKEN